jgi:large subunit ribosomal protein L27
MSKIKAGGSSKNNRDSPGQRLGVKISGGQKATVGQIIIRQIGMTKRPGPGTKISANFTIHAAKDGIVSYETKRVRTFTGRTVPRTFVSVK